MSGMSNMSGGFYAQWSPGLFLLLVAIGYVYFLLIGSMRHRFTDSAEVSFAKKLFFVLALLILYAGQGSPINYYGHGLLFSAHMVQQTLMYLILPPLFYLSLPEWLIRPLLMKTWMLKWVKPLFNPLIALFGFNILFSFYHIPLIFNFAFDHPFVHNAYHIILTFSAFHMWFLVFCPLPEWNRISPLQKMGYIFANGVLLTPACALIIFAGTQLYPGYAQGTLSIGSWWLSPLEDQRLGGTLMKVIQEAVYGTALGVIFFKWYNVEKKKDDEADLAETNPTLARPQHSY